MTTEQQTAAAIAADNDLFRRSLVDPIAAFDRQDQGIEGEAVFTQGIFALGAEAQPLIIGTVAAFNCFSENNDPNGEHDFGAFDFQGTKLFWKIDLYNSTLTAGSENPLDMAQTRRVLTVMLASEY